MDLEKVTQKNVKVNINFDIDLDTLKHYIETKEADKDDVMAIYDMMCTHFARLAEQDEPDNIRAFFDIDPETFNLLEGVVKRSMKFKTSFHPHLRRIK